MTPVQVRDGVTIYNANCLDVLPTLASVDAIVTDPPYGVDKAEWDTTFPTDWIQAAWRVTSRMLVMPGNTALIEAGQRLGNYQDCIALYAKNGMTRSPIAFGNWIPVLACGDWGWEARPNVLPFVVTTTETIDHPSPKPLAAMLSLIARYTKTGWTILDPFMGSGTTGVACIQLGRRFIGIERDKEHFEEARQRLANAKTPLLYTVDDIAPEQLPLAV